MKSWDCESFPEDYREEKEKLFFCARSSAEKNTLLDRGSLSFFRSQVRWQMMSKYTDYEK